MSEFPLETRPDAPRAEPTKRPMFCLFGASSVLREGVWTRLARELGGLEADSLGGNSRIAAHAKACVAAGRLFCLPSHGHSDAEAGSNPPERILAVWLRDAGPPADEISLASRLGADVRTVQTFGGVELVYCAVRRAIDSLALKQLPEPWVPPGAETSAQKSIASTAKSPAEAGATTPPHSPQRAAASMRDKLAERRETRVRRRDRPVSGRGGPPRR